jgi:hypothetical protein
LLASLDRESKLTALLSMMQSRAASALLLQGIASLAFREWRKDTGSQGWPAPIACRAGFRPPWCFPCIQPNHSNDSVDAADSPP